MRRTLCHSDYELPAMSEVPLGELLIDARERVPVEAETLYPRVGVRSFGRGLFTRPAVLGADTSYTAFYRLSTGQFVYSKLFGWEGALAVAGPEHDGTFVSSEFPVFRVDTDRLNSRYLAALCQWPVLWERLAHGVTGMGGRRKRVPPAHLLDTSIPLPEMQEQLRITDLLESVVRAARAQDAVHSAAAHLAAGIRQAFFLEHADHLVPLVDLVDVTMGRQRSPRFATGPHMTPYLRAANVKDGVLDLGDVKQMNFDPLDQLKYQLEPGDVLVTEGCGSLTQIGASAQWQAELPSPVCFQNTLVRLRGRPGGASSDFAYQWARHQFETGGFAEIASGTNIYHLGARRLARMLVPRVDSGLEQVLVDSVKSVEALVERSRTAARRTEDLLAALRDQLLGGARSIGDGYDTILIGAYQ
jgi:type I restriction enzyme S subunit